MAFFFFLAAPQGMRDVSSPARDQTHAPCSGSTESQPKSLVWLFAGKRKTKAGCAEDQELTLYCVEVEVLSGCSRGAVQPGT